MPSPESIYFIDTSFHISYCIEDEDHHQEARIFIEQIREKYSNPLFLTTDLIFAETINRIYCSKIIRSRAERQQYAIQIGNDIIKYNNIIKITPEMFFEAWRLFTERNQQGYNWSFVDCSSFVFIKEIRRSKYKPNNYTIKKVLTFDEHFISAKDQFGFEVYGS
jgi:predicted nucleic acid-binding protein